MARLRLSDSFPTLITFPNFNPNTVQIPMSLPGPVVVFDKNITTRIGFYTYFIRNKITTST